MEKREYFLQEQSLRNGKWYLYMVGYKMTLADAEKWLTREQAKTTKKLRIAYDESENLWWNIYGTN